MSQFQSHIACQKNLADQKADRYSANTSNISTRNSMGGKVVLIFQIVERAKFKMQIGWKSPVFFKNNFSTFYYFCIIWHLQYCLRGFLRC